MGRLQGKRCIITGAASGIGRAGAEIFAREAAHVAILDFDGDAARSVAEGIVESGGKATAIRCDVADGKSVESAVAQAADAMGGVDVCWANAGTGDHGSVVDASLEHFNRVLSINLTGMFLTAKYAIPRMIEAGGGSMILTSSSGVLSATQNVASAMSAKGGVLGLVRQMSADFVPHQIRVNAVCPGPIVTPALTTSMVNYDRKLGHPAGTMLETMAQNHPRKRLGRPEDVANVALFLASDDAAWVSAQFINVSGTGH
ncbi:MAG: SDR family oxidoreductase [Novosphingobium sp.]|nr:SDR family oxidoreductase [Novosphingobium sp.]